MDYPINQQERMTMKTDDLDIDIFRHLWDGRTPYSEIASSLGITTNTVRTRVNRLKKNGALQIIGLVDPEAVPGHYSAFIGFKVKPETLKESVEKIGELKGVVAAASVTGRFDIIAVLYFNKDYSHRDFIFDEMSKVEGIVSVETFFVMDAVNWQLRYVL